MALKQHAKGFTDDLNKLTEQQLRSFLEEELDSEDVNVELIKNITDVLAAKTNAKPIDAETAYRQFMSQYADTDPLYMDMEQELSALEEDEASPEADVDDAPDHPRKVVRFSRLAKFGILVAAVLVLFLAASVVASAMGFNIWRAAVTWDKDNMGVSSVQGDDVTEEEDPYYPIRSALQNEGVSIPVVPFYLPKGYELRNLDVFDSFQGRTVVAIFQSGEKAIHFSYVIHPKEINAFYPKDNEEPEIYTVMGIDHFITSNEGQHRAVWANEDIICELYGIEERAELQAILDSIYEG